MRRALLVVACIALLIAPELSAARVRKQRSVYAPPRPRYELI